MSDSVMLTIPDLGNVKQAEVIEIMVKVGDKINKDDSLITLESDKASMEIPASTAGVVREILVKIGDKMSSGDAIIKIEAAETADSAEAKTENKPSKQTNENQASTLKTANDDKVSAKSTTEAGSSSSNSEQNQTSRSTQSTSMSSASTTSTTSSAASAASSSSNNDFSAQDVHAGPGVRRLARELGVNLGLVTGSGPQQRILAEDVHQYVKQRLANSNTNSLGFAPLPEIDFAAFGTIDQQKLSKIKRLSGQHVLRSSVSIPHVTQFDEADITELEAFRVANKDAAPGGAKLTLLVFIMKAVVACLKQFPQFNSSLAADGETLILKRYFHLGVAVDTPDGLVVPVIQNVDQKGIFALATELGQISEKARNKKLMPNDMQGGCFSISSLGGIGGTRFTPIINAPEVAILGVSKTQQKPVFLHNEWVPRLSLPLSLSYDHRVIDGADGARFTTALAHYLGDIRKILL